MMKIRNVRFDDEGHGLLVELEDGTSIRLCLNYEGAKEIRQGLNLILESSASRSKMYLTDKAEKIIEEKIERGFGKNGT